MQLITANVLWIEPIHDVFEHQGLIHILTVLFQAPEPQLLHRI